MSVLQIKGIVNNEASNHVVFCSGILVGKLVGKVRDDDVTHDALSNSLRRRSSHQQQPTTKLKDRSSRVK